MSETSNRKIELTVGGIAFAALDIVVWIVASVSYLSWQYLLAAAFAVLAGVCLGFAERDSLSKKGYRALAVAKIALIEAVLLTLPAISYVELTAGDFRTAAVVGFVIMYFGAAIAMMANWSLDESAFEMSASAQKQVASTTDSTDTNATGGKRRKRRTQEQDGQGKQQQKPQPKMCHIYMEQWNRDRTNITRYKSYDKREGHSYYSWRIDGLVLFDLDGNIIPKSKPITADDKIRAQSIEDYEAYCKANNEEPFPNGAFDEPQKDDHGLIIGPPLSQVKADEEKPDGDADAADKPADAKADGDGADVATDATTDDASNAEATAAPGESKLPSTGESASTDADDADGTDDSSDGEKTDNGDVEDADSADGDDEKGTDDADDDESDTDDADETSDSDDDDSDEKAEEAERLREEHQEQRRRGKFDADTQFLCHVIMPFCDEKFDYPVTCGSVMSFVRSENPYFDFFSDIKCSEPIDWKQVNPDHPTVYARTTGRTHIVFMHVLDQDGEPIIERLPVQDGKALQRALMRPKQTDRGQVFQAWYDDAQHKNRLFLKRPVMKDLSVYATYDEPVR